MNDYKVILFDLDGTLLDTSAGIYNSVRFAQKKMGFTELSPEQLRSFIGPPPIRSYMNNYGVSEEVAKKATEFHRQYGSEKGVYEAEIYSGMKELLQHLKDKKILLGVCTLKRQDIAEKVLKHFNLYDYFNVVVGIDQQESLTKADTINIALEKLNVTDKSKVILIGDSMYDALGAEEASVGFLGVLYGFGLNKSDEYEFDVVDDIGSLQRLLV